MVKKRDKGADAPQPAAGWGAPPPADNAHIAEGSTLFPEGNGNISTDPENRQPPLDEGWDDAEARQRSEAAQEEERPVMGMPAAGEPAPPAEPKKPKKGERGRAKATQMAAEAAAQAEGDAPPKGHNSQLTSFVERLERLAEERQTITDDMKEVVAEAKAYGYNTAILKKVMARRKRGYDAVKEEDALINLYQSEVGWN